MSPRHTLLYTAYAAFNRRDAPAVLALMDAEVQWPKAFEGGYVQGQAAVADYWAQQWAEIDPVVTPLSITDTGADEATVRIRQIVLDHGGSLIASGIVQHVYTFDGAGKVSRMQVVAE